MALIASGLPCFDQVADFVETICMWRIISPVIIFAVYGVGERALPASRVPVPSAMRRALVRLATNRNEMDQLVNGFVRASTICFGWVICRVYAGLVSTSMLEYGAISLPAFGDSNWMWRALGAATAYDASSDSKNDASYLTSIPADDLPTIGILTARVLSNGVSLVFNNFNFGGSNLPDWISKTLEYIVNSDLFIDTFCLNDKINVAPVYAMSLWATSEFTGLHSPLDSFYGASWNDIWGGRNYAREPNLWITYQDKISYFHNCMAL
ncbi:hypothetical protein GJ496_005983 [Pomphorhynchus laevis]|nr:hypothetical protein GJ496_005983 [Pomphorhynchus laevis]